MSKMIKINDYDLLKNKNAYSLDVLETNKDWLTRKYMVITQKLNAEFVARYILNDDYADECFEDDYVLCLSYVLFYQPHISKDELMEWIEKIPNAYY